MADWFSSGGIFMLPITIIGITMLAAAGRALTGAFSDPVSGDIRRINMLVLQLGMFAFFMGLLSQIMGLSDALGVIQQVGSISPALIAGGIKVSLIAPMYGLIILLVGWACWSIARFRLA